MDKNTYRDHQFIADRDESPSLQSVIFTFVSEPILQSENIHNVSTGNYLSKQDSNFLLPLSHSKTSSRTLLTATRSTRSSLRSRSFGGTIYKENEDENRRRSVNKKNIAVIDDDFFTCLPKRRRSGNIVQSDILENCQHEQFNIRGRCVRCSKIMKFFLMFI